MDTMKHCLLSLVACLLLTSCQQGGGKGGGVVVVDVGLILQHSQDIAKAKEEAPRKMAKVKEIEGEIAKLNEEARKTLDSMADKGSLAYRDKEESFRNRHREIAARGRTATLNVLTAEAEAYDRAYRDVMEAALRLARAKGASAVLPLKELPKPSLLSEPSDLSPFALMQTYFEQLSTRPVIAASAEADITTEVLEALGWAR